MKNLIIDGQKTHDRAGLHQYIAKELDFPQWYGKNLDALFDCLTDLTEETHIEVVNRDDLYEALGGYANALLKVLSEASEINRMIEFNCEG